jgi:hypothetical protein
MLDIQQQRRMELQARMELQRDGEWMLVDGQ